VLDNIGYNLFSKYKNILLLLSINITKLTNNLREESMINRKFKSYLITNIPETDWKKFKRWTAVAGYSNLNDAFFNLIKLAGEDKLTSIMEDTVEHTT
tara:strand:- start:111 stop:404 length:294 start_codon:yes stop_codon:yes gene_type:complete